MSYKITITNPGNHFYNSLLPLRYAGEFATREEACEAIYAAMYDTIDGDNGCEMVEDMADKNAYHDACHAYIMRTGHATEDGVSAIVEEVE